MNLSNPASLPDEVARMLLDLGSNTRERISAPDERGSAGQEAAIRAQAQRREALRQATGNASLTAWSSMSTMATF